MKTSIVLCFAVLQFKSAVHLNSLRKFQIRLLQRTFISKNFFVCQQEQHQEQ